MTTVTPSVYILYLNELHLHYVFPQETWQDKFGHIPSPSLFIADDSPLTYSQQQHQQHQHQQQQAQHQQQRRPKSPKGTTEKKDEKVQQKKTLNKFFKIFN